MWNEVVYSPEQIIERYGHVIEETLRDRIMRDHDTNIRAIELICRVIQVEYDWKNSPEGFDNWLMRMIDENQIPEKIGESLAELWEKAEEFDREWKSVYYGLKRCK